MKLREWQQRHYDAFIGALHRGESKFCLEAVMGGGKSYLAAVLAEHLLNKEGFDFVVCVVPWDSIRGHELNGMTRDFDSVNIYTRDTLFVSNRVVRQPEPKKGTAFIVTYQAIADEVVIELLKYWSIKCGLKFAVIFDEVHHTSAAGGQWGYFAEQIHAMASFTITMSGTYFRTDQQKIRFLDYTDSGRPILSCPGYTYPEAIKDGVCRPVTFDYNDPEVRGFHDENGEETHLLSTVDYRNERFRQIKKDVLAAGGECVRQLIVDAHRFMDGLRRKFPDAGMLFTCAPSGAKNEDRYVHQITQLVRNITREEVIEVVASDKNAAGHLERFRVGRAPYLVAINKVAEGANIPRLRGVTMLRYTESEMLFRQIVGRALRMTDHEDGTAACVFMPKFAGMYQFALNMYGESLAGIQDRLCGECGQFPCICPCEICHEYPCVCVCPVCDCKPCECTCKVCGRHRRQCVCPGKFVVTEVVPSGGGGSVGADDVYEDSIALAEQIKKRHISHQHSNTVQLAHGIQEAMEIVRNDGLHKAETKDSTPLETINRISRKIHNLIGKIAYRHFEGDFQRTWTETMIKPHRTDWKTASVTWQSDRLEAFAAELERFLVRGAR